MERKDTYNNVEISDNKMSFPNTSTPYKKIRFRGESHYSFDQTTIEDLFQQDNDEFEEVVEKPKKGNLPFSIIPESYVAKVIPISRAFSFLFLESIVFFIRDK